MASYQRPKVPAFAGALSPGIVQLHSIDYRNSAQLQPGGVLITGAGNSGAEIAMETARGFVLTGQIPFLQAATVELHNSLVGAAWACLA